MFLEWQQFKLPCHHALGAVQATGRLNNMKAWYDHAFESFYLAANYAATYANVAVFLPQMETLEGDRVTLPAERVTQAGRPENKRFRSRGGAMGDGVSSKRVRYGCSTCGSKTLGTLFINYFAIFHKIDRVRRSYQYFDLRTKTYMYCKPTCTSKKEVRPHLTDRAKSVRR